MAGANGSVKRAHQFQMGLALVGHMHVELVLGCTRPGIGLASPTLASGRYQQSHCDAPVLHTAVD